MERKRKREDLLRKKAEKKVEMLLGKNLADHLFDVKGKGLLNKLQVYMIQLAMQNEELKATQLALEKTNNRYQELYDSSPACYLMLDGGGLIYEANLTSTRFLGISREKIIGKYFQSLLTPESADSFHLFIKKTMKPKEAKVMELQIQSHKGSPLKATVRVNSVSDNSKRPKRYRVIFIDPYWFEPREDWKAICGKQ